MESFKLNLYQNEIYVFTPRGELKILPQGATPVDFAFSVHSNIGFHSLSAKVNGKIVPLDSHLRSGDQVEIITSKNQKPKPDWEQFVVTHKAKSHIRKYLKDEERKEITAGRETWEKRLKKSKFHVAEDDLEKYLLNFRSVNLGQFYVKVAREELDPDGVIREMELMMRHPPPQQAQPAEGEGGGVFQRFISAARNITSGITLFGREDNFMHSFGKCCNPIPGDEIAGFVTTGEGVKVHVKTCRNFVSAAAADPRRVVDVGWPVTNGTEYAAAIRISGEDRTGMLNDITHSISTYQNTNIRGVKIDTKDALFEGTIMVGVKNTEHLQRIIEKLRKIKGVSRTERLVE
jgi:(p)ppGpp synthase/HD superfamily hydrolase